MSIAPHATFLNDRLTKIERAAEQAPAGTFLRTKDVADAVSDASNAVMEALKDRGFTALNNDRLRELEAMIYGYLLAGNPGVRDELAAAEGLADALDGPAAERVLAQLTRDRDAAISARGSRWVEGHRDDVPTEAWAPLSGPYQATNELTIVVASTVEDLLDIGQSMNCVLNVPTTAAYYAHRIAEGLEHIFLVRRGSEPVACGELEAKRGSLRLVAVRGRLDRVATKEAIEAIDEYVSAVNQEEIEVAYEIGTNSFVARSPTPTPGM